MPSSRPLDRLDDVIRNCDRIAEYTSGLDFEGYVSSSSMVRDAVERCLQRISEAAYKLGSEMDARYPDADWEGARGVGNILRHQYDGVDDRSIWTAIIDDLPKIRASAQEEAHRITNEQNVPRP